MSSRVRGVAHRGSPVIGGLECARPYGMAWITTMVPRVAAKMTESNRKLVSLDTVDVLKYSEILSLVAIGYACNAAIFLRMRDGKRSEDQAHPSIIASPNNRLVSVE